MFLLVPICAVGVGLLFPLLARQKAEVTKKALTLEELQQWKQAAAEETEPQSGAKQAPLPASEGSEVQLRPAAPMEDSIMGTSGWKVADWQGSPTALDGLPPGVRWETEPDVNTFLEGKVQLDVRLLSEGMFVALRRHSAFNGSLASEEHLVTSVGTTSLKTQPGEYDVLVRDEWFGWGTGNRSAVLVRETGMSTLTVQRDLSASVRPLIDLDSPAYKSSGEQPHYRFQWNRARYQLTRGQALAVQKLVAALFARQPDVPDSEVVACIREPWRRGETLEENFRNADGALAWGKLVVPGQEPGAYRLAPIPTATLIVDVRTPGMQVEVLFPREDVDAGGGKLSFRETGQHQLIVWRPGTYGSATDRLTSPLDRPPESIADSQSHGRVGTQRRQYLDLRGRTSLAGLRTSQVQCAARNATGSGSQLSTRLVRSRKPGGHRPAWFRLEPGAGGLRLATLPGTGRRKARCNRRGTAERGGRQDDVRAIPRQQGQDTRANLEVAVRPGRYTQHVAAQRAGVCRNVTANRRRRDRRIATRIPVRRRDPQELIGRQEARVHHRLAPLNEPAENDQSATRVNSIRPSLSGSLSGMWKPLSETGRTCV